MKSQYSKQNRNFKLLAQLKPGDFFKSTSSDEHDGGYNASIDLNGTLRTFPDTALFPAVVLKKESTDDGYVMIHVLTPSGPLFMSSHCLVHHVTK